MQIYSFFLYLVDIKLEFFFFWIILNLIWPQNFEYIHFTVLKRAIFLKTFLAIIIYNKLGYLKSYNKNTKLTQLFFSLLKFKGQNHYLYRKSNKNYKMWKKKKFKKEKNELLKELLKVHGLKVNFYDNLGTKIIFYPTNFA